jgi:hypothetical protein
VQRFAVAEQHVPESLQPLDALRAKASDRHAVDDERDTASRRRRQRDA